MGSLSACHRDPDAGAHFHIRMHPMVFAQIDGNLLSEVGYEPTFLPDKSQPGGFRDVQNTEKLHVEDEGPKDDDGIRHASVWIFPGTDPSEELRVHFVYGPQQYDDTFDRDVRVEVRKPYTVRIDGRQVLVTQQVASTTILAAYAEMIRLAEAQADPATARAPVVAALRQLAPFNTRAGVGGSLPANPWAL